MKAATKAITNTETAEMIQIFFLESFFPLFVFGAFCFFGETGALSAVIKDGVGSSVGYS